MTTSLSSPVVSVSSEHETSTGHDNTSSRTGVIYHLPLELLREIFILCLTHDRSPNRNVAPLLICHVCSRWRDLAFSVPELWNELRLSYNPFKGPVDAFMRTYIDATELWFRCIGRYCPFSYILDLPPKVISHNAERSFTSPLPPSLRFLALKMNEVSQLTTHIHLHADGLASLERMRISISSDLSSFSSVMRSFPFGSAIRLRRLALDIEGRCVIPRLAPSPWTQLTHLVLGHDLSLVTWHEIIRYCTQLQECFVEISTPSLGLSVSNPIGIKDETTLLHLTDLTLLFSDAPDIVAAVEGLHFPAITSLHLECAYGSRFYLSLEPVQRIFRNAQLKSLTLRQGPQYAEDLLGILEITTTLDHLEVSCGMEQAHFLSRLRCLPLADGPTLVPQLTSLVLVVLDYNFDRWSFSSQAFIDTVQSRWWVVSDGDGDAQLPTVSCLKYVSLAIDDRHTDTQDEVRGMLVPLIAQGLHADVHAITHDDWLGQCYLYMDPQLYCDWDYNK
ncbi:hypothetical protein Hypma_003630 [Hypsizygus marmoreus]|uniref:Uncharacterized protein n=1 Tax=Hypsizygus marmoreus TaxID=39966 RepID=A0A369JA58_HYPMA|nr:hypothetical protein Hypma_003630 [Hypsizygus marmoreus]